MRAALAIICVAVLSPVALRAQAADSSSTVDHRAAVIADIVNAAKAAAARRAQLPPAAAASFEPFLAPFGPNNRQLIAAYLMAANAERPAYASLLKRLEAARVDKQVGAPPNANASTSLAMKGLAPRIFGVAVERGAATREVSGNALTFRANPVGLAKALRGSGLVDLNDAYSRDAIQHYASRLSLAATFDISRGSTPGVFTGDNQQLSAWSARYEVINRRDPASPAYAAQWSQLLAPGTAPYRVSVETLNDALSGWKAYTEWETNLLQHDVTQFVEKPFELQPNDVEGAAAVYQKIVQDGLTKLEAIPMAPAVGDAIDRYARQLTELQSTIDDIYAFAGKGALLTVDWSTVRDVNLPDLNTGTVIFETALGKSRKTDVTLNASGSYYRLIPANASHSLKSVNLTGQLEHPLGNVLPTATISVAGRYSYLPYDTVAIEGVAASTPGTGETSSVGKAFKGAVGYVQAKLTIPIKDSGLKVPLSITASNRSELIKEKDVRGSVGITFDLDTFVSALTTTRR
jgi:hypothetical protein